MTDYAEWLRGQCIYTKMARRSMRKHLERDYCEHCAAAEEFERLSCEVSNLKLANKEARKTIDRLNELIPREANDGGPVSEGRTRQQRMDAEGITEQDIAETMPPRPEEAR